jgi:hypothetical protein
MTVNKSKTLLMQHFKCRYHGMIGKLKKFLIGYTTPKDLPQYFLDGLSTENHHQQQPHLGHTTKIHTGETYVKE